MSKLIIVAYDISKNKTRSRFSKFLEKYGVRVQFSVYEIENSQRVLDIVSTAIEAKFKKQFEPGDSVYIFTSEKSSIVKYGSANLLDNDLIFI
ncbi:MAG: CRISPR-associated endonuclease Cas2 [Bacteroidetes bacterium]|nr:CRISPR-associated endonuclease Cas2 [Bacteroidota bacterium]